MREYVRLPDAWERHGGPPDVLPAAFEDELAALPGPAVPPLGDAALAVDGAGGGGGGDGAAFGAALLVPFDEGQAEVKRLYVRPHGRRRGAGRGLVVALLGAARASGYRSVVLDVMPERPAAVRLYEGLGFRRVEPFRRYDDAHEMLFFRRTL